MVTSSLIWFTILKTVLSEHVLRQLCVKVHRRLEDPQFPKRDDSQSKTRVH